MKKRSISETFLNLLKNDYSTMLKLIRVDPYLDLELRQNKIIVYYRGGRLFELSEDGVLSGLNSNYAKGTNIKIPSINKDNIDEYIHIAKHIMDMHESGVLEDKKKNLSKLAEKEIQQRIVYENNLSANAKDTDYYIVDVEWADNDTLKGRADIVAFRCSRKEHRKRSLQLTLIEVKQGDNALRGPSGLTKHYDAYKRLKDNSEDTVQLAKDMRNVLKQKHELGLIKGLDFLYRDSNGKIMQPKLQEGVEFAFVLANYHYYSSNLANECMNLDNDALFFRSSFMGYGLYKAFALSKEELMEQYNFVFSKGNKNN